MRPANPGDRPTNKNAPALLRGVWSGKRDSNYKYLSKLIKQASGRSAPDWIDDFVILEAKNLLKYTDLAIKEIVYKLHFPNQSVFFKFFHRSCAHG